MNKKGLLIGIKYSSIDYVKVVDLHNQIFKVHRLDNVKLKLFT